MPRLITEPPAWGLMVFRWFAHPLFREELEGDLYERYEDYLKKYGHAKARWLFLRDVASLFRPSLMGSVTQLTNLNSIHMIQNNKRLMGIILFGFALLALPLVAMQFTASVDWDLTDFIIMGGLLLLTGLGCELVLRKVKSTKNRLIICAVILVLFLLTWAELAVGVFGTPFAGS